MKKTIARLLSGLLLSAPLSAVLGTETVGDAFRKVMAQIDAQCMRDKRGPYLDRADPEYRKKAADTSCDIVKLHPRDWRGEKFIELPARPYAVPVHWLETPEGKVAHGIRLPEAYDKAKQLYRDGMTPSQYFEVLCREEAGEFIFHAVNDVDVVFELRPREEARPEQFHHLFAMEDPYGYVRGESRKEIGATWTNGNVYREIERAAANGVGYERLARRNIDARAATIEHIEVPSARYAFVWRGIVRPHDRENGIAGGEIIVIDLETKEVLGFRRGFALTRVGVRGASWEFAPVCPNAGLRRGRSKDFDFGLWFVSQVLRPRRYEQYREELSARQ